MMRVLAQNSLVIEQFLDPESSTLTYLLGDRDAGVAIIIDPVKGQTNNYLDVLLQYSLRLEVVLDTHIHADHITAAYDLRIATGSQIGLSARVDACHVDLPLQDHQQRKFGGHYLTTLETPGHTEESVCFVLDDDIAVFTGDTLLIDGCGRADFQNGSANDLYDSIKHVLYGLNADCLVFPGHDYHNRRSSRIALEKEMNQRLNQTTTRAEFLQRMHDLMLPRPKLMDRSIPANLRSGD